MGFVIWYELEVAGAGAGGLRPLRVSNDVFSGDYILDADIRVELVAGSAASGFTATLANLPADVADTLKSQQGQRLGAGNPLQATISLGYFDDPATKANPVLRAEVTSIRTRVGGDGLLETVLVGNELAGYRLLKAPVRADHLGSQSLDQLVRQIADQAGVAVQAGGNLAKARHFTLRSGNGLEALRTVAEAAEAPLVISDGPIFIGDAVGRDVKVTFSAQRNIVSLDRLQEEPEETPTPLPPGSQAGAAGAATGPPGLQGSGEARTSLDLTILGDPNVRVGQAAVLVPADPKDALPGTLRVERVRHTFSTRRGYTCDVTVAVAEPGKRAKRLTGAPGVVDRIRDLAETVREQRPAVDMGEVASYDAGPAASTSPPSVTASRRRRTLSPPASRCRSTGSRSCTASRSPPPSRSTSVAWSSPSSQACGRCWPTTGVGERRGRGRFLWAERPKLEPPKNETGDWWLCLPTGKGVNDLTDKAGRRVVRALGLRVTVGEGKLPDVGERPQVPSDLGGQLLIEHEGGTTITVDSDGAVTVDTGGKDITLKSGDASITLSRGSITLHGSSVEVS